jgi:hypothetical protein
MFSIRRDSVWALIITEVSEPRRHDRNRFRVGWRLRIENAFRSNALADFG